MRNGRARFAIALALIALVILPGIAMAGPCLGSSDVVGRVPAPTGTLVPRGLPAGSYALYWLFHDWCSSCRNQAGVIKSFVERNPNGVKVYAVPLSGTRRRVSSFLDTHGLGGLEVLWGAAGAFGNVNGHPVLVFRKAGDQYYRVNGFTDLAELERAYRTFKGD